MWVWRGSPAHTLGGVCKCLLTSRKPHCCGGIARESLRNNRRPSPLQGLLKDSALSVSRTRGVVVLFVVHALFIFCHGFHQKHKSVVKNVNCQAPLKEKSLRGPCKNGCKLQSRVAPVALHIKECK